MVPTVQRFAADVFLVKATRKFNGYVSRYSQTAQRRSGESHGGAARCPRAEGGVPDTQFYPDDYVDPA